MPRRCASSRATRACCAAPRSAAHSNAVLAAIAAEAAARRRAARRRGLARRRRRARGARRAGDPGGLVDLIIPRGGEGLKAALKEHRDGAGDLRGGGQLPRLRRRERRPRRWRVAIAVNAKVQRPGVCNAAETLLVHRRRRRGVPAARAARRCARGRRAARRRRTRALAGRAGAVADRRDRRGLGHASSCLMIAVGVVDSLDEAIDHVNRHGSGHSEAIVTGDLAAARAFSAGWTRPASTSTPRRASPTAASSAWAPRSATRPRSCTPAARSACASCCTIKYVVTGDGHVRS